MSTDLLPTKTELLDILGTTSIALDFLVPQTKFDTEQWWLSPLLVMAFGWSLWRRKSFWGPVVVAFGVFMFWNGYTEWKKRQEVTRSLAARMDAGDAWVLPPP
jgi:hypothetical protein